MVKQSLATQQNFNSEELEEEKELFEDNSLQVHSFEHDYFLNVEMSVYSE